MKKSKFLKSSKDMLSRSFNPSKCKTSLRLASSRVKLLRNKKEGQVMQIRREISLLLQSGQDLTARIRVEHVVREDKMVAAYELIGIYCELIVSRLSIIETQKTCPIDLKEAIASVVYAALRCGDVPELSEVKKQFTEKYGKSFITAAVELRPDCGVSRMLIEKLSTVAPDGQTKLKILSGIAEEYNVEWDPEAFEQKSMPSSDLLSEPSTFGEKNERPVEPIRSQGPDIKAPQSNQLHETKRPVSSQVSGFNSSFQHEEMPQGGEKSQFFRGDSDMIPNDRRRWSMEFKDATSAAQAAAESAELASMAARAAAQLSTRDRMTRQYSNESRDSDHHHFRDGAPDTYMRSNLGSEQHSNDSTNRSFSEHSRLHNGQVDKRDLNNSGGGFEGGRDSRKKSPSLKSKASTDDDDSRDSHVPVVDRYSQKSTPRQSFKNQDERSHNAREETIRRRESFTSSHSHSSISSNVNTPSSARDQDVDYHGGENTYLGHGKENNYKEASRKSSFGSSVVFDRSDSDTDNYGFDRSPAYDEPQQRYQVPSSSQKRREHLSERNSSWSPKSSSSNIGKSSSVFSTRKSSPSAFPEQSKNGSKLDDSLSVTFDESDEQSSESEEKKSVGSPLKDEVRPAFRSPRNESSQYDRTQLSLSSEYESEETDSERNQGRKFRSDHPPKLNLARASRHQPTLAPKKNRNEVGNSSTEIEEGLNFGKLTGGFRHKGYNYSSFGKNQVDVSSSKKESKANIDKVTASPSRPAAESPKMRTLPQRKDTKPNLQSTSDTDSSEEEEEDYLRKNSDHKHKHYPTGRKDLKTKPSFAATYSTLGSESSDSDEDIPKGSLRKETSRLRSGISRRTKTYPTSNEKEKHSKLQLRSEVLHPNDGMHGKTTASTSYESPKRYETTRNTSKPESYEQHNSRKVALDHNRSRGENSTRMHETNTELRSDSRDSRARVEQKLAKSSSGEPRNQFQSLKGNSYLSTSSKLSYQHSSEKPDSGFVQDSKHNAKSSDSEETLMPQRKSEPNLNKTPSNKDSSNLKASHVHPKLPDYDSLVQMFRKN